MIIIGHTVGATQVSDTKLSSLELTLLMPGTVRA